MSNKITLDTGLKTFEIDFSDRGTTAEIRFNPSDPDLALRFSKLQERINSRLSDMDEIELNEDGTPKDLSYVNTIEEINEVIYAEIDYAFGNSISKTVFQYCNPMASINGEYFIVSFIKAIAPVIKSSALKEKKELEKHLDKYRK